MLFHITTTKDLFLPKKNAVENQARGDIETVMIYTCLRVVAELDAAIHSVLLVQLMDHKQWLDNTGFLLITCVSTQANGGQLVQEGVRPRKQAFIR